MFTVPSKWFYFCFKRFSLLPGLFFLLFSFLFYVWLDWNILCNAWNRKNHRKWIIFCVQVCASICLRMGKTIRKSRKLYSPNIKSIKIQTVFFSSNAFMASKGEIESSTSKFQRWNMTQLLMKIQGITTNENSFVNTRIPHTVSCGVVHIGINRIWIELNSNTYTTMKVEIFA